MSYMQLGGIVRVGLTPDSVVDVSDDVTTWLITRQVRTVPKRQSFGNPEESELWGGFTHQLQLDFDSDADMPNSLRNVVNTAGLDLITTTGGRRPGEIWVEGAEKAAPVSATNKLYGGWVLPVDIAVVGGTVGEVRSQSVTWSIRAITESSTDDFDEES